MLTSALKETGYLTDFFAFEGPTVDKQKLVNLAGRKRIFDHRQFKCRLQKQNAVRLRNKRCVGILLHDATHWFPASEQIINKSVPFRFS